MTRERLNHTIQAVAILAAAAALAASMMPAAGAAPQTTTKKHSHSRVVVVHHKKPIVVKIEGDHRAAQDFAEQAYSDVLAQRQAAADAAAAQARANRENAAALANQQAAANAWASPYYSYAVPSGSTSFEVTNPVNVVAPPYYGVQTLTMPTSLYGSPTINNYGSYGNGAPFSSNYSVGSAPANYSAPLGGFFNLKNSFYSF